MDEHIIRKGKFKGCKIVMAPTAGVDAFQSVGEEFMEKIFGFKPGDYLITDESNLFDFLGAGKFSSEEVLLQQVKEQFNIDVTGFDDGNLYDIFRKIHKQKYG